MDYFAILLHYYLSLPPSQNKMNASDWKKAAAFISDQNRLATTAPTEELDSLPLSTLSLDESSPPEVTYSVHTPLTTSTPNSATPQQQDFPLSDNYQQILPQQSFIHYATG